MSWNQQRAIERIKEFIESAPEVEEGISLAAHFRKVTEATARANALGRLPRSRAVLVKGVHLYGQLLDFEDLATEKGVETEASHRKVLDFLNLHYRVWDAILEEDGASRVDYHGPRLHAVLTEPADNPSEQIQKAIALAARLTDAARRVCIAHNLPTRIRFGIDHGACLAMSTGRSHEKDTLFLGAPANHAAKLAAQSNAEGIFLTENARMILDGQGAKIAHRLDESRVLAAMEKYTFYRIEEAANRLVEGVNNRPKFIFHRATPPLAKLNFDELTPANSVRMGMASMFADIDGFTAYVDRAIASGSEAIKSAVISLHVLREELNSVLKEDFGGKRVRFIGDCIQGLIAAGETEDDPEEAVKEAVLCAAAMRSSFSLCQMIVAGIDELDLAIGVEFGLVPLTRLGARGTESVRCAAGKAVIESERAQQSIEGGGIRLGAVAQSVSGNVLKSLGNASRIVGFAEAADLLGDRSSPITKIVKENPSARPYSEC